MSADYFQTLHKPVMSRIPLRRSNSFRGGRVAEAEGRARPGAPFQRGGSFMERGERRQPPGAPGGESRIRKPTTPPRNRSLSLSLSNGKTSQPKSLGGVLPMKTPPTSPDTRFRDWDTMSTTSTASNISIASCDHASVARNGTTFSGRSMKYVLHCSDHSGISGDEYLTPTQRAHKQVRKLKQLLQQAKDELEQKDSDILRLTKEVVELRLYKAALNSPEEKSNSSSDAVTVRDANEERITPLEDLAEGNGERFGSSCTDSGHFEDYTNSSVHSKDSARTNEESPSLPANVKQVDKAISVDLESTLEHQKLILEYEVRVQELIRTQEEECHQMKQQHNDKVEELLQRLSDVNERYWKLVPDLDAAKERIKDLESELEKACRKLQEQEQSQKQIYMQMYSQGEEAGKMANQKEMNQLIKANPSRISVSELLHQLQATQTELENLREVDHASSNSPQPLLSTKEAVSLWVLGARKAMYRQLLEARSKSSIDPEITLQFLKSAIYYFLTDKENNQGHLKAILSILGFTPNEISNIDKARSS